MADLLAASELIELGRDLVATVAGDKAGPFEVKTARIVNMAHAPAVHALTRHALRLGSVVLDLYERDLRLEAMPTVRATYETALTAAWLSDSREAVLGLVNEGLDQRRKLADSMAKSASVVMQEAASDVARPDSEEVDTVAGNQARWFRDRCLALQGVGEHGYAYFRLMSAYAHPSALLVDQYLVSAPDTDSGVILRTEPEETTHEGWLFLTVASMMWAARSLDVMHTRQPHRSYLRGVARQLGVTDVLRLTSAAHAAEVAADRARRQAEWRGRRRREK